jgi:ribosomal protein S18 acetylase RimI-like enzyme
MNQELTTPNGAVLIRQATSADAAQFRELRLSALQNSPTAFGADYQKSLHEPLQYWEERLTFHPDEAALFLAQHHNDLIGMTGIVRGSSPKTRHSATIWGVYVRPEWRGLHIAEELIKACLTWAGQREIIGAVLGVTTSNTSAIRCYERCGFEIIGTEPRALYHGGGYHDFYRMYRPLDDS